MVIAHSNLYSTIDVEEAYTDTLPIEYPPN
ncbi:hypothetical protein CLV65_1147 [Pseudoscardovia suis]|uniref:Uncharacterized protein n=1 Tax=Pseudoscardovia suis TaxID=987063 RepID=A0A261EV37_9BIFI|nr:hypothetical protein PSSU_1228 [Pseudoscardovia suis]PJJ65900.1 hypothetical protein CLV65_1147 [Pseudoscardovia suis]